MSSGKGCVSETGFSCWPASPIVRAGGLKAVVGALARGGEALEN